MGKERDQEKHSAPEASDRADIASLDTHVADDFNAEEADYGTDADSETLKEPGAISKVWAKLSIVEVLIAVALFVLAAVLRIKNLGTIPEVVTADEADNLHSAYRIIEGTGTGLFGFDWKPAPIFSLYPLAWCIQLFGDSILAFRLFPAITSLATIVAFWFVCRLVVGVKATAIATLLLSTNLIFLHFSRTAWENVNSALFALGACATLQMAVKARTRRSWWFWWVCTGIFCAFGLYGYFTGRLIPIAVAVAVLLAVLAKHTTWRKGLAGLVVAGVVSAVLFAPMALSISKNWEVFTLRSKVVSIIPVSEERPFEDKTTLREALAVNLERNYEGLILQDDTEMTRGLWGRYTPERHPPLGFVMKHFLWLGLGLGVFRWRRTWAVGPFFIPVFAAQVFSSGTPDMARGISVIPLLYFFVAFGFDELIGLTKTRIAKVLLTSALMIIAAVVAYKNVQGYYSWQSLDPVQSGRLPGIAECEWELWRDMARASAVEGGPHFDHGVFDQQRRELACSPIVNGWLQPPIETPVGD